MSCRSPLTVAMMIVPRDWLSPAARCGLTTSRPDFIVMAETSISGTKILPSPKSLPTTSMAAMSASLMMVPGSTLASSACCTKPFDLGVLAADDRVLDRFEVIAHGYSCPLPYAVVDSEFRLSGAPHSRIG